MTCRSSEAGTAHPREIWVPVKGIAVMIWPGEDGGALVVDSVRGRATWRGVPLRIRQQNTVVAFFGLATGKFGRQPMPRMSHDRMRTIRDALATIDMWIKLEDGRFHIVRGWEASKGAIEMIEPDADDLADVEPVAAWKGEIERPAPRVMRGLPPEPSEEQRVEVLRLRDQGYRPIAIAAITRLPYDAVSKIATFADGKPKTRKIIDLRGGHVAQCRKKRPELSHNVAFRQGA